MKKPKNYIVTGASGFLGKIITNSLISSGANVISIGRSVENNIIHDLSEPFQFSAPDLAVDTVIHIAGKAHSVPKTDEEKEQFFKVNYQGTKNLTTALLKLVTPPTAFIFISTVSVYGLDEGVDINENFKLNGISAYAKSKIEAEQWLQQWAAINNVKLTIFRLPLVAGENPPGNLGKMINGIKSGKYLSIGNASAKKSVVWGNDIVDIIPIAAECGGIFNLTDGNHPSFKELEEVISSSLGLKKPFKIPIVLARILSKLGDIIGTGSPINTEKMNKITSTLTFDDSNARVLIGWKPNSVLKKLQETLK
ncbi:MAG: NAD-dependent epimerase/dehydratase family protein [Bacteroidota bacterium]